MPELNFKGKEFVHNHHLAVPHRPLIPDAAKSLGEVKMDGNLIIHGDNLHALKALLPMYAGKVDFAPVVGIAIIFLAAEGMERGLVWLYAKLPL